MNDQDLQTKLDADSIAKRIFVDYQASASPPTQTATSAQPTDGAIAAVKAQQIPACAPCFAIVDVRLPWNAVARLVLQVGVALFLLVFAIGGMIAAVRWALKCV
jgi:hypothetical protein